MQNTLSTCREIYNSLVHSRTTLWDTHKQSLSLHKQQAAIAQYKKSFPELTETHSQVLQNVAVRVDLAFKAFFRRASKAGKGEAPGYPRLKGRGVYDSFTHPQWGNGVKLIGEFLHLSKIGQVRVVLHRPLVGTPKTCTVRRQAGKWFACITIEVAAEVKEETLPDSDETTGESIENASRLSSGESIGVDVGLHHFAALSDGSFIDNPRFFRRDEKALAKAQRKLSKLAKLPKASAKRRKARKVVSRIHERVRNRRHDFVHQLARKLVDRYSLIAVEKLNIRGMVQNHRLAKSISDAAWSMFRTVLSQKAERAMDRQVVEVNAAYTTQDCSRCGFRLEKSLKERWHDCPACGLSLDRDTNAAFNILNAALNIAALGQQSIAGVPGTSCLQCIQDIPGVLA